MTFGCRLNTYESELIKGYLKESGLDKYDIIVLNSCNVTNEAEKDLNKQIRRIKKDNPNTKIILTGCIAQANPQKYANMDTVDFVMGNFDKTKPETYTQIKNAIEGRTDFEKLILTGNEKPHNHADETYKKDNKIDSFGFVNHKAIVNDIMSIKETSGHLVTEFGGQTRAFIQIQNGCNHRCTFCVIPYGRGNSRSVGLGEIVREVNGLVDKGFKEFVLTGVDITDYGKDISSGMSLGGMIKRLLAMCPGLMRLRLSSIDVAEVDRDLLDLIFNEPRFMPHLHLSLQSGNDLILKRMARRHTRGQILDFYKTVRASGRDLAFGADIIAGFPTEDETAFMDSYNIINECEIAFLHAFTFSPRIGTPAAKMPQIEPQIRKERTKKLIENSKTELERLRQKTTQTTQNVLIESKNIARCENFVDIPLPSDHLYEVGEIYTFSK